MSHIMYEIQEEIKRVDKMLITIKKFHEQAPKGGLKYQKKGKEFFFYQQCVNEESKLKKRIYIKKDNLSLVRQLAQKHYYSKLEPLLRKRLKSLKSFQEAYHPDEAEKVYEELSEIRKTLVLPLLLSKEELVHKWNTEEYEGNPFHPENLRYETEQGEMVRSKSEVIIANLLYSYRKDILYKYERPLILIKDGIEKTIYPDFTILNRHTGRIIYFEHAGKMDDTYYANEFVKKMNTYVANGFLPGRDVLVTYETMANPLDVSVAKRMIEGVCVGKL